MNFVTALKCGTPPKIEAARCIHRIMQNSKPKDKLCLETAAEFVNELFKAIGLSTRFTPQQLEMGGDFNWRAAGIHHYIFHRNARFFNRFERFLTHLSQTVSDEQVADVESKALQLYSQLLGVWCGCCIDLRRLEVRIQDSFLAEPIARINYKFFLGVHELSEKFKVNIFGGDLIHRTLLTSTITGLHFEECHSFIVGGLSQIIEKSFGQSRELNEDIFQYFRLSFGVGQHRATQCGVFKILTRMLDNASMEQDKSNHNQLVSFLIERSMQETYYTFLKSDRTKCLLLGTLKFLKKLIPHLLDLECFSQTFLESLLDLAYHRNEIVASSAAELYVRMARCKARSDDYILKHIMEFYFEEMTNVDTLLPYINALWDHFPYIQSMGVYFKLLKDAKGVSVDMYYFIAHFAIAVYKKILGLPDYKRYLNEFIFVFETLPTLFEELDSQCVKCILLQIYGLTEEKSMFKNCVELKNLLYQFEDYVLILFRDDRKLKYLYMFTLLKHFVHAIAYTGNTYKFDMCISYVYTQYEGAERALQPVYIRNSVLPEQVDAYCFVLQKLGVLMQLGYTVYDQLERIVKSLHRRLFETNQLQEFADKQIYIEMYAIDVMVSGCIRLLSNGALTQNSKIWLLGEVRALEAYIVNFLSSAGSKTNAQLYRLKTYFICLANLYYALSKNSIIPKLTFNIHTYYVMVQTLLTSCLQRKPQAQVAGEEYSELHPMHILYFQKYMFQKFTQLHSSRDIPVPSPVSWKLCIHYGGRSHKFSVEIFLLMQCLTKFHFTLFTEISAVLIYNLYNQQPPFEWGFIQSAIHSQKSFVEQLPHEYMPKLLCFRVVLRVLEFLQQALMTTPPTNRGNRLEPLKDLYVYGRNLDIKNASVLNAIIAAVRVLQNHMLNNVEHLCLKMFLRELDAETMSHW